MLHKFSNFPGWLYFGSYFWKNLRHFCWRNSFDQSETESLNIKEGKTP